MLQKLIAAGLVGSALFFGTATGADRPAPWNFRTIDVQQPGVTATFAYGINAPGDIVGSYIDSTGRHGFLLQHGTFTPIDFEPSLGTFAFGINDEGDIVGYYIDPNTNFFRGFLRHPSGNFDRIDFPASLAPSDALSPNNTMPIHLTPTGMVVGCFHHASMDIPTTMHGFVYQNGAYSYLSAGGANNNGDGTMSNGITPAGRTIVGLWQTATVWHAFMVQDGVYQLLDGSGSPLAQAGAIVSQANDINPSGEIVGYFTNSNGQHGFLLGGSGLTQIDVPLPGVVQTVAWGIDPQGDIVGFYRTSNGAFHGFVATSSQGQDHPIVIP